MADAATDDLKALEATGTRRTRRRARTRPRCGRGTASSSARRGCASAALGKLGAIPKDQKAAYGQEANRVKAALAAAYESPLADDEGEGAPGQPDGQPARRDAARPRRGRAAGCTPRRKSCGRSTRIFADLGFQVYRTPRGRDRRD